MSKGRVITMNFKETKLFDELRKGEGIKPLIMLMVLAVSLIAMLLLIFFAANGAMQESVPVSGGIESSFETESSNNQQSGSNNIYPTIPTRDSYIPMTDSNTQLLTGIEANSAKAAIIVDASNMKVLASYHGDTKIFPASMTKVMTIIVALEHLDNLTDTVVVSQEDHKYIYDTFDPSGVGFTVGERLTVEDMLYAIAVESDCLASYMLAKYISGTEEAFVELMNQKAEDMGLKGTHFANSHGLHDDNNYSTVRDMAAIMAYALDSRTAKELLSAEQYKMYSVINECNLTFYNTLFVDKFEKLLKNNDHSFDIGSETFTVIAGKTGYVTESGQCLVSYTESTDGHKYIVVTAGSKGATSTVKDLETILKKYSY